MRPPDRALRLSLAISGMGSGGAERVLSILANAWAERGHRIALHTLTPEGTGSHYPLDPRVQLKEHGLMAVSRSQAESARNTARRVRALRRALLDDRADLLLSFGEAMNFLALGASIGAPWKVIVSDRVHPDCFPRPRLRWALRGLSYVRADRIVVQTAEIARTVAPWLRPRVEVIPNPIPAHALLDPAEEKASGEGPRVLAAAGRLVEQKGFDLLLPAFAEATRELSEGPGWALVIYGEGEDREALEAQARALGIADRVRMPGVVKDLPAALARADAFVLSSRYEGFPNALCEAMAVGLPVVSFRCPSGPAEIVRHGRDGLLVATGDVAELARALGRLMRDPGARDRWGRSALEVRERFSEPRLTDRWTELIERVAR